MILLSCFKIFSACVQAINNNVLLQKSRRDKEYFFQDWFANRLDTLSIQYDDPSRNKYPDFTLVNEPVGFELKALAFPGRETTFDANSNVPSGNHNGRTIYYVFGRYPNGDDSTELPIIDLVMFHGDLLNANHDYVHKNRHAEGFGSYGDILIRDRKMYVVPTPFCLLEGVQGTATLITPSNVIAPDEFVPVGQFVRREANKKLVEYSFNLKTNELKEDLIINSNAGKAHEFIAWRLYNQTNNPVILR